MKIAVGLSGGVDSAVALLLLKSSGHEVFGLFMKNWEEDDSEECSASEDLEYATAVCTQLSVPLHTVNFSPEYWDAVFQVTLEEYQAGRTPNPDILCNQKIKFNEFLEHAKRLGAEKIATGHYAGIAHTNDYALLKGKDLSKDQSYFLYRLEQKMLESTLFPLSDMNKQEVRKLAQETQLKPATRRDSVGICFIGKRNFRSFLGQYLPEKEGEIVDENNRVVGRHDGAWFYTIGQRYGLGIGGVASSKGTPWYVAEKDMKNNRLLAVQSHDHPALFKQTMELEQVHWIGENPPKVENLCAKIRHQQADQACSIEHFDSINQSLQVRFDSPQWGVAPGQSVVFYEGVHCLGGGVIQKATSSL